MEYLSKQQIVLLTLLVSFVTSIATGIVAVSLMGQSPQGVTETINHVVEKTIERVVSDSSPTDTSTTVAAAVAPIDPIPLAVDKVSRSLVRLKPMGSKADAVTGLGVIVSKDGIIVTDKSAISSLGNLVAVFSDGQEFPIQVVQSQIDGDIVFVVVQVPNDKKSVIIPLTFSSSIKLGQSVLALSGKESNILATGLVKKVEENISTSIPASEVMVGSPVFDLTGNGIGIRLTSLTDGIFYSFAQLKQSIPVLPH